MQSGFEIIRKQSPEMAIVGLGVSADVAIESLSFMSREFPFLYLLALSEKSDADLILRTMRAGAHDFLCKPVKEADLRAAAEKVFKLKDARKESPGRGGKIVSIFSNKGGNGTTMIAVNLADALVRYHGKKVVVVDLVLAHGDVTMFFNVNPSYSIMDLAKNAEKADYDFLHTLLMKHSSGVYVLADPPMIEDAESISARQVKEMLSTLRSMFDVIIIDTAHQFDERTLTALESSDVILLVTLLNLPSLKNTQKCLDLFGRIGFRDERIRLVLSRYLPSDEIPKESIEGILKTPIFFAVPNDYPTVISSINRGKLLREIAPDKEVTKSFHQMADLLLRSDGQKAPPKAERKRGIMDRLFRTERSTK
jgi:pilus assembly protein CpaE